MNKINFGFDVKGKKEGTIVISGYANANTIDRCKERIDPSAWQLDNYKKNPVVLFDHGHDVAFGNMPIGKARLVEAKDGGLYCEVEISNSKTERISAVRDLIEEGILKTFSVGFDPKTATKDGEVSVIKEAELIEISAVPLPMNQDSTFSLLSKELDKDRTKKAKKWFNNYKKKFQSEIIAEKKAELSEGKLYLEAIIVNKIEKYSTLEKAQKHLNENGYIVDDIIDCETKWIFNQQKNDGNGIIIDISPAVSVMLKAKKPKEDTEDDEEIDKACGDKPKEDEEKAMTEPGMDEEKPEESEESSEESSEEKPEDDEEESEKSDLTAFLAEAKATATDGPGNPPSWVANEDAWAKAKEAADESYSREDAEKYWAVVTWLYLNRFGGTRKEPEKSFQSPEEKNGAVIPTGADAVRADSNPMIDLAKQNNVLIAGVISELQRIYSLMESMQMPKQEETPSALPLGLPPVNLSLDTKEDEIEKCIEKIKKTQQDLNMRLKRLS